MDVAPTRTAADLNTVARFLAAPDLTALTPVAVEEQGGAAPADLLVLLGNAVLATVDAVAAGLRAGVADRLLIAGGTGHSTRHLRMAVRADPRCDGLPLDERAEAEILRDVLARWHGLDPQSILVETQSTNCGANAKEAHALLRDRGLRPDDVVLVQDPTMQRRTRASFRRVWGDPAPRFHNAPPFVPTVEADGDALVFAQPDRAGLWPMERFVSLVMGEIPRLRNDENGYGPNGRGYIAAVDIPPAVEAAYDRLLGPFGDRVRPPG
ncbi:MAG: YdcF family protein [Salinibacter sp.]